ncbi:MAG: hypothetical protein ACREDR_00345 [Blastocatellia bacterium]
MAASSLPAIADIRYHETSLPTDRLRRLLCRAFADKGYAEEAIAYLAARGATTPNFFGFLLGHFLMRTPDTRYHVIMQQTADALVNPFSPSPPAGRVYSGTQEENAVIDASIATSPARDGFRRFTGRGSARVFSSREFRLPRYDRLLKHTPVAILGAGAAGTMMARALVNAGYLSVTVLDQTGGYGGIWRQPNVRGGSKNNPFSFNFEGVYVGEAPGPGESITRFLEKVVDPSHGYFLRPLPAVKKAKVLRVEPGDLHSLVTYSDETGQHTLLAPIVINTLGLGRPLPPSRVGVMTTDMPAHEAGIRWQQILDERQASALDGKMLVFIGLGNSTAEMLVQVQRFNRLLGLNIRYKVLTHYPKTSLARPDTTVAWGEKLYRLYRDTGLPQLTRLAGDLDEIERAFVQARDSRSPELEEIIPEVTHWTITKANGTKTMVITLADGSTRAFDFNQLYTLIGYSHRPEELAALGMLVADPYLGSIAYDYDGEIQRVVGASGRERVWPGYYGLGSLLKTPQNPNAQVIPGLMYRLSDTLFSVIVRSTEYGLRRRRGHGLRKEGHQ